VKARVTVAPIKARDKRAFLEAVARSRKLHSPWVAPPSTAREFTAFVKRMTGPHDVAFLVRAVPSADLVGFIEITNIARGNFRSGYLGYFVFAGHERRGLMKEALRLVVRRAFAKMKLHRLEANIQPGNAASKALVKACGFVNEGYSERYLKIGGRWRDHERWAILAR
jgi:ribosomal-protein-alanine N-acetyltransferase